MRIKVPSYLFEKENMDVSSSFIKRLGGNIYMVSFMDLANELGGSFTL